MFCRDNQPGTLDQQPSLIDQLSDTSKDATGKTTSTQDRTATGPEQGAPECSRAQSIWAGGYHYQDPQGNFQGPFNADQLLSWRSQLPDNLELWHTDGSDSTRSTLASLLDSHQPSAAHSSLTEDTAAQSNTSAADLTYSEASLAGQDDDVRDLARLAAERGTSLSEIVAFCHQASAAPKEPELSPAINETLEPSFKSELDSQAFNPVRNWKQAKKRRQRAKQKQRNAWLCS